MYTWNIHRERKKETRERERGTISWFRKSVLFTCLLPARCRMGVLHERVTLCIWNSHIYETVTNMNKSYTHERNSHIPHIYETVTYLKQSHMQHSFTWNSHIYESIVDSRTSLSIYMNGSCHTPPYKRAQGVFSIVTRFLREGLIGWHYGNGIVVCCSADRVGSIDPRDWARDSIAKPWRENDRQA